MPQYGLDEAAFQRLAERIVPLAQAAGAAVMIAGDSRIAVRTGADGLHHLGPRAELADVIARLQPKMMVGADAGKTRDEALAIGELGPDYVFFGRFGYDGRPEPHPRNLDLGAWWAEMVEIACIVQGGSDIASVAAVAATGAEFVALSAAVLGEGVDPRAATAAANGLLEAEAPRFEVA